MNAEEGGEAEEQNRGNAPRACDNAAADGQSGHGAHRESLPLTARCAGRRTGISDSGELPTARSGPESLRLWGDG